MIIDRYLTREAFASFVGVCCVLMIIFVTYSLARFLTDAASGLLRPIEVIELTGLKSLVALEVLMPIALYFGLIIALGNLHSHYELIALQACGVSTRRYQQPAIRLAVLLTIIIAAISAYLRPWAYTTRYTLEANARAASEIDRIQAGEFYLYEGQSRTVFVDRIDGDDLHGVFIRTRKGDDIEVISSSSGRIQTFVTPDSHKLVLNDAHIFKQVADGPDFTGVFGRLTIPIKVGTPEEFGYKTKTKSTRELYQSTQPEDRAEFQWRLSTPLSTLLLAMLALKLSHSRPREGRFAKLPLALGIYAVYFNLLGIGRTWVEQRTVAHIWWVPALLGTCLLIASLPWRRMQRRWA